MRRLGLAAVLLAGLPVGIAAQQADTGLRTVLANGYRFAYVTSGTGHPVILVHGELTDYRFWDSLLAAPPDSLRLIAYSRRYHAPNPWRPDDSPYGFETSAADLAAIIRALRLERPLLVGHGWGAGVALQTALRYPELVTRLVLVEPIADSLIEDAPTRARMAARARSAYDEVLARNTERDPLPALRVFVAAWFGQGYWERIPEADREMLLANAHTLRSSAAPEPNVSCALLAGLHATVLLVRTDSTSLRLGATLDGLAHCLPATPRRTLPGAGPLMMRAPGAALGEEIRRFATALPR